MNLFLKLFTSYVIAMIFFMGLLPRIFTNILDSDKSEVKENPIKFSYVLINS